MYTVYKVTNLINHKYYIGVHKTNNPYDAYMGSGLAIKEAIRKYGLASFIKEILFVTEDKQEAYAKEKELTVDFDKNTNYNMKQGGIGGWTKEAAANGGRSVSFENKSKSGKKSFILKRGIHSLSSEEKSHFGRIGGLNNKGKPKSQEHKDKLSAALKGKKYKQRFCSSMGEQAVDNRPTQDRYLPEAPTFRASQRSKPSTMADSNGIESRAG